ncbi:MAG TPA: hypothetical protein VK607_23430 [Kofleriaceae bacterium]|nr:hypothetical protein [Kofleriaceae bacterium]
MTVMSDLETADDPNPSGIGRIVETATFCAVGDPKRPGQVDLPDIRVIQVCPNDVKEAADATGVAEAVPPAWFVRIVFDKLLNPAVEELIDEVDAQGRPTGVKLGSLKHTQPVTLRCNGADVPYDGYYAPNGNRQSWPLGPSLFIEPLDPTSVPVGSLCTIRLGDDIHSKTGQAVPDDQRDYQFQLAAMALRFSEPAPDDKNDGSISLGVDTPVDFFFTAPLEKGNEVTTGKDKITLSKLPPAEVNITFGPNKDGEADPAVCDGSAGAPVDPTKVRTYLLGTTLTTTQLVLRIDLGDPTSAAPEAGWEPDSTYRLQFVDGATVEPLQHGDPAELPGASDYTLCFHTPAAD